MRLEQILTDNPDLLVGNLGPGMMGGAADPNMNPEDAAAIQQGEVPIDPETGQPLDQEQMLAMQQQQEEAYELFGTTNLNESMSRFKYKLAQKMQKRIQEDQRLDEAVTTQPYRYSSLSF